MQPALYFAGLLASLVLSFVSSGMETALYRVSRVRMRIRAQQGEERAALVIRVLDRLDSMVTAILINNNIAAYAGTYLLTLQLVAWRVPHSELITTAVITPLFFVLTESLPKQIVYNSADRFALELVRVFSCARALLSPMVWILNRASAGLRRVLGSRGEADLAQSQRALLLEHLNAGVAEKVLTEEQNRMAVRIMELESINAVDSMIPLPKLTLLPASATRAQALASMSRRRTQLALIVDGNGVALAEAVTMNALVMKPGEPSAPVRSATESLEKIRPTATIPEVLTLFRSRHARHAVIVDKGRVRGLITTQSVLDRIAGINR